MAKITTKITVYVDKYERTVLTEKEIEVIKRECTEDFYEDAYEVDTEFRKFCKSNSISHYDIFTMSAEDKASLREDFEKCVAETVDYGIRDDYEVQEIEVELEING